MSVAEKVVLGLVVGLALLAAAIISAKQLLKGWGSRGLVRLDQCRVFGGGTFAGGFDLGLDRNGFLYLMDLSSSQVLKFNLDGQLLARFGGPGEAAGKFREPYGLAVGPHGDVYVADTWNGRVQKFSSGGTFLGQYKGEFYGPRDVAVDGQGNIYVADSGHHQIAKYRFDGEQAARWGSSERQPGSRREMYNEPRSLDVDGTGNVFIYDVGNRRIKKVSPAGEVLVCWRVKWARPKEEDYPFVAVGDDGNIYVSCPTRGVVASYTPRGKLRAYFQLAEGPFHYPTGVAFANGRLYVVDKATSQIFSCAVSPLGR